MVLEDAGKSDNQIEVKPKNETNENQIWCQGSFIRNFKTNNILDIFGDINDLK